MKRSKFYFFVIIIFVMFLQIVSVNAASFSLSSSTKQVAPNGSFTIKVGGDCIGRVNLSVSNGTLSTNSVWVEQGYVSVKVTALSSGSVTVTAIPVEGFSDSDANIYNPGSRSVVVNVVSSGSSSSTKPSTNTKPNTNTNTVVKKKSSNNNLSSLTVGDELSPKFDSSQTEYTLSLPASTDFLTIKATTADSKATLEGVGKVKVKPGNNIIKVTVTAENGSKKVYSIKAYVDDAPQVYFNYKKVKIGVIRNYDDVSIPKEFKRKIHEVDKSKIDIFVNEGITIIYGLNEDKSKDFYLFDKDKNELVSKFIPLTINNREIYVVDSDIYNKNLEHSVVSIDDKRVDCYKFEDGGDNYCLLNTVNTSLKTVEYLYESSEKTIQLYPKFLASCSGSDETKDIIIYGLGGLSLFMFLVLTYLFFKLRKGGKNEKTK